MLDLLKVYIFSRLTLQLFLPVQKDILKGIAPPPSSLHPDPKSTSGRCWAPSPIPGSWCQVVASYRYAEQNIIQWTSPDVWSHFWDRNSNSRLTLQSYKAGTNGHMTKGYTRISPTPQSSSCASEETEFINCYRGYEGEPGGQLWNPTNAAQLRF